MPEWLVVVGAYLWHVIVGLGVVWFGVGLLLGSLLMLPQCGMYLRNYRRWGNGAKLLRVFLGKLALMVVMWPMLLGAFIWSQITALKGGASRSESLRVKRS